MAYCQDNVTECGISGYGAALPMLKVITSAHCQNSIAILILPSMLLGHESTTNQNTTNPPDTYNPQPGISSILNIICIFIARIYFLNPYLCKYKPARHYICIVLFVQIDHVACLFAYLQPILSGLPTCLVRVGRLRHGFVTLETMYHCHSI